MLGMQVPPLHNIMIGIKGRDVVTQTGTVFKGTINSLDICNKVFEGFLKTWQVADLGSLYIGDIMTPSAMPTFTESEVPFEGS